MKPKPLNLKDFEGKIKEEAGKLEDEVKKDWKIKKEGFFIELPTSKRFLKCKEKDWEIIRLYGMLHATKEIKQHIKSAVEWLKEQIAQQESPLWYVSKSNGLPRINAIYLLETIDKAFEDVIKEENN